LWIPTLVRLHKNCNTFFNPSSLRSLASNIFLSFCLYCDKRTKARTVAISTSKFSGWNSHFTNISGVNFITILCSIFYTKVLCAAFIQLLYSLALYFSGERIAKQKLLVKCWWNWLLVVKFFLMIRLRHKQLNITKFVTKLYCQNIILGKLVISNSTPRVNFINILRALFCTKVLCVGSFSKITVWLCDFLAK